MIIVKIELHSAITGEVSTLGTLHIVNDGTGTATRGNYYVDKIGKNKKINKTAKIKNWPRKAYSVFKLLRKSLEVLDA